MSYPKILIAGTGGIGQATAVLLSNHYRKDITLYLGNRHFEKAVRFCDYLRPLFPMITFVPFHLPEQSINDATISAMQKSDILLDCLPGDQAIRMAQFAIDFQMHYANLTEHVKASEQIQTMASGASKGFILQTGLAPGFINILGHYLYDQFRIQHESDHVLSLQLRVGALTQHAMAPHFYGFTWSPAGVATEYIEEAQCIRNYEKVGLPSLSERESIILQGIQYEADLTSGGTADLADYFSGRIEYLDYKTLRYPGHYKWVEEHLDQRLSMMARIEDLQKKMIEKIPQVATDEIILYAIIIGLDKHGARQQMDSHFKILPRAIEGIHLRAIQLTTAAPLAQCALQLLQNDYQGIVLQSQINPIEFLNGEIVQNIFGPIEH